MRIIGALGVSFCLLQPGCSRTASVPGPAPTTPRIAEAPPTVAEEPTPAAVAPIPLDSRRLAAWSMVLYLKRVVAMGATQQGVGCDPSLEPTFGVAKTDPWGSGFVYTCEGDEPRLSSPGPDRELGTPDDVTSWVPIVEQDQACSAAHTRATACEVESTAHADACRGSEDADVWFAFATCAALEDCADVETCLADIERYVDPEGETSPALAWASCDAFVRIAAKLLTARDGGEPDAADVRRACEDYGMLRYAEQVCMEASTSPEEAALCHLTVYRGWADPP